MSGGPVTVYKGDYYGFNAEILLGGVPVDIAGYKFEFIVKEHGVNFVDSSGSLDKKDAVIYEKVTMFKEASKGVVTVILTGKKTGIDAKKYKYRLYMTNNNGGRTNLLENDFFVKE